jgi:hypothetical protein
VDVYVKAEGAVLHLDSRRSIRDDGMGAHRGNGSGLIDLTDRAEALGDHRENSSPDGRGTTPVRQSRSKPTD